MAVMASLLVIGTDDQIEVVGAALARAEEFEARRQPSPAVSTNGAIAIN